MQRMGGRPSADARDIVRHIRLRVARDLLPSRCCSVLVALEFLRNRTIEEDRQQTDNLFQRNLKRPRADVRDIVRSVALRFAILPPCARVCAVVALTLMICSHPDEFRATRRPHGIITV